jgi:L-asparaginase
MSISKDGNYCDTAPDGEHDPGLSASINHKLTSGQLAGFVIEGLVPQGPSPSPAHEAMLLQDVFSSLPVARAGHNAPHCFVDPHPYFIAASNLTGAKARLLLMACLLQFGSLPPAGDPAAPTPDEQAGLRAAH